jgi:hypothetical protein
VGRPEGRKHLEDPGVDGKITLKSIFKKWDGVMGRIELAQNRDRWRDLVKHKYTLWANCRVLMYYYLLCKIKF